MLESIIFTRKHNKPFHPQLVINQKQISEFTSHKHLGLIFSIDYTWHEHIENIKVRLGLALMLCGN